ncbi:MAG: glycosyltransferase family 2 protein [Planctomycetaceae bacterium]|nr:glycosyltransferase family 2 protein [Planctomycetaceae bacterium]
MPRRVLTALPVYNEESHVLEVLNRVRQWCDDILVVDDGSSDRTPLLLAEMEGIQTIRHEPNQGYGGALRSAFNYAIEHDYDVLVTIDCDGQHEPQLIPSLAAAVFPDDEAPLDIVSGSRYLKQFAGDSLPPEERRKINMEVNRKLEKCFGLTLTDSFCGFKAYRVEALKRFDITELGYAMPLQLWVQAVRHRMRIREFPVPLIYLDESRSFGGSLDDSAIRLAYYEEVLKREMENQHVPCGSVS